MTLVDFKDRSEFGHYLTANNMTGTGVEVGVFKGEYSNEILSTWGGTLIGVDSYNKGTETTILNEALELNKKFIDEGRYRIVVCNSVDGPKHVSDDLLFVYIDAEHTEKAVMEDISAWYPKIKHMGILCGHDLDLVSPGVRTAVEEFLNNNPSLKMHHKMCGSWFIQKQ